MLHSIAERYPEDGRGKRASATRRLFETLPDVLPCIFCRQSLALFYDEIPMRAGSRSELARWWWEIHKRVNLKLSRQDQKNRPSPSLGTIRKKYTKPYVGSGELVGCVIYEYDPKKRRSVYGFLAALVKVWPHEADRKKIMRSYDPAALRKALVSRQKLARWWCGCPLSTDRRVCDQHERFESQRAGCRNGKCLKGR